MIEKAVEFLKRVSLTEPIEIHVEAIMPPHLVSLSYKEKAEYSWGDRIFKQFNFKDGEINSMTSSTND